MLSKSRSHVAFVVSRAHRVRDRLLRARSVPSEDAKGCPVVAQGAERKRNGVAGVSDRARAGYRIVPFFFT